SEEHTSELQSLAYLVCRLLLEKKKAGDTRARVAAAITSADAANGSPKASEAAAIEAELQELRQMIVAFFFFNDPATTEIYTLSLHDALPISAESSWEAVVEQARAHGVGRIALADEHAARQAARAWPEGEVWGGAEGLVRLVVESDADLVLNALVGSAGLGPTVATLGEGIDLALANKESLVVGGELVVALAEATAAQIVPVDSEHTALHQLLSGQPPGSVERLTITASGGPFRGRSRGELADVSVEQALAHPTWAMGGKITIDSATLMNKGLELM